MPTLELPKPREHVLVLARKLAANSTDPDVKEVAGELIRIAKGNQAMFEQAKEAAGEIKRSRQSRSQRPPL